MNQYKETITQHYSQPDLDGNILGALEKAGKNTESLTRADISSFDEFHIRGLEATLELAQIAGLKEDLKVLDLGCGIGGPARTLAAEFGCEVTGLDLVEQYCHTAEMLTERVGLGNKVRFRQGNMLDMPFEDASFDVVWSQHTAMNIEFKELLYGEIRRVLRPEGRLALYEICSGYKSQLYFPVPWASDPTINFLISPDALLQRLQSTGFREVHWEDVSAPCLEWFQNLISNMASRPADAPPPLGLNLIMGSSEKAKNITRNLEEDRVRVVQGVLEMES
jgi:SAM-dependent methyltransferase